MVIASNVLINIMINVWVNLECLTVLVTFVKNNLCNNITLCARKSFF